MPSPAALSMHDLGEHARSIAQRSPLYALGTLPHADGVGIADRGKREERRAGSAHKPGTRHPRHVSLSLSRYLSRFIRRECVDFALCSGLAARAGQRKRTKARLLFFSNVHAHWACSLDVRALVQVLRAEPGFLAKRRICKQQWFWGGKQQPTIRKRMKLMDETNVSGPSD